MTTTVQKWGNSSAIRIPKAILEDSLIKLNDEVDVIADDNKIVIRKATKRRHITLEERLKDFKGEYVFEEWDTGPAVGAEIWWEDGEDENVKMWREAGIE